MSERVWAVVLPLPVAMPDHVVSYVVRGQGRDVTLIDAGDGTRESWDALVRGLAGLNRSVHDVQGLVSTHFHPDHMGMVTRLREVTDVNFYLHPADGNGEAILPGSGPSLDVADEEICADYERAEAGIAAIMPQTRDVSWFEGDRVELGDGSLRIIETPGHTAGHVCLLDERDGLLFSGDHILPTMHPTLAAPSNDLPDPGAAYLESLRRVSDLPVELVLPAHGPPFRDVSGRAGEHMSHQLAKTGETLELVHRFPGRHAFELASRRRGPDSWSRLTPLRRWAAYAKTWALLVTLAAQGEIVTDGAQPATWNPIERKTRHG